MSWKDIIKISTKDAISDAKRFASEDVEESSKESISDVFRDEFIAHLQDGYWILDYKKDFDKLYNMRFYDGPFETLELRPKSWNRDGYVAIVPYGIHMDNHKLKFEHFPIFTPKDAEHVKKVYIQNWEKAVKIFNPSERDASGYR